MSYYDEDSTGDDLEISVLFAAIGTSIDVFNFVVRFLTEEDAAIAADMVLRSKENVGQEEFNSWIASRVISLVEAEKIRQGLQTVH